jgi:hypothetical protein
MISEKRSAIRAHQIGYTRNCRMNTYNGIRNRLKFLIEGILIQKHLPRNKFIDWMYLSKSGQNSRYIPGMYPNQGKTAESGSYQRHVTATNAHTSLLKLLHISRSGIDRVESVAS